MLLRELWQRTVSYRAEVDHDAANLGMERCVSVCGLFEGQRTRLMAAPYTQLAMAAVVEVGYRSVRVWGGWALRPGGLLLKFMPPWRSPSWARRDCDVRFNVHDDGCLEGGASFADACRRIIRSSVFSARFQYRHAAIAIGNDAAL